MVLIGRIMEAKYSGCFYLLIMHNRRVLRHQRIFRDMTHPLDLQKFSI